MSLEFTDTEIWLLAVITGIQQGIILKPYSEQPKENQQALDHLVAERWISHIDTPGHIHAGYFPAFTANTFYWRALRRKFKIWKLKRKIEVLENEEIEDGSKNET